MCQWNSNKAYENQTQTQILSAPNAATIVYSIYVSVPAYMYYIYIYSTTGRCGFRFQRSVARRRRIRSISLTNCLSQRKQNTI